MTEEAHIDPRLKTMKNYVELLVFYSFRKSNQYLKFLIHRCYMYIVDNVFTYISCFGSVCVYEKETDELVTSLCDKLYSVLPNMILCVLRRRQTLISASNVYL